MESIYVRQRLRPSRYAFLVKAENIDGALQAASINCALWGGIYNPIVPVLPQELCNGLLRTFDPDYLVNLTGEAIQSDLEEHFKLRIVNSSDVAGTDGFTSHKKLNIGFNILPILYYLHEKEVRFLTEDSRVAIVMPQEIPGWPEFAAFFFGSFRWLPELDTDFETAFAQALRARRIVVNENQPPENFTEVVFPINNGTWVTASPTTR